MARGSTTMRIEALEQGQTDLKTGQDELRASVQDIKALIAQMMNQQQTTGIVDGAHSHNPMPAAPIPQSNYGAVQGILNPPVNRSKNSNLRGPRCEFPQFNGENPRGWLWKY